MKILNIGVPTNDMVTKVYVDGKSTEEYLLKERKLKIEKIWKKLKKL